MVSESATWTWACFLKTALLLLGVQCGFTISYLDPKSPTKALLAMSGCQIIVSKGGYTAEDLQLCYLADISQLFVV